MAKTKVGKRPSAPGKGSKKSKALTSKKRPKHKNNTPAVSRKRTNAPRGATGACGLCQGVSTVTGKPCRRRPKSGSKYCFQHTPSAQSSSKESKSKQRKHKSGDDPMSTKPPSRTDSHGECNGETQRESDRLQEDTTTSTPCPSEDDQFAAFATHLACTLPVTELADFLALLRAAKAQGMTTEEATAVVGRTTHDGKYQAEWHAYVASRVAGRP